jgi:hypothetical protein
VKVGSILDGWGNIHGGVYTEYGHEKRAYPESDKPLILLGAEDGIWTRDPNLGNVM